MTLQGIYYNEATGQILGRYSASESSGHQPPPAGQKALIVDGDITQGIEQKYKVVAGEIIQKQEIVFTADKAVISADGVDETTITITPSVNVNVMVNATSIPVTPLDNTITITSDVEKRFTIEIPWDNMEYYANPIEVFAT